MRHVMDAHAIQANLPWHARPWAVAEAAIRQDRIAHAWLIHGQAGLGKGIFARRLAAALLCLQPAEPGEACGRCQACAHLRRGTHPDFLAVAPEPDKQDISVDAIRALTERLSLKAEGGRHRVALIAPADGLTVQAMNALLKTLEEPPGQGVLLLVSERPSRLLPTIRSRCRAIAVQAPDKGSSRAWLSRQLPDTSADALETALAVVRGGPLAAATLLQGDGLALRRTAFDEWLAVTSGRRNPVAVAEAWQDDHLPKRLRWLNGWVLDLQRLQATDTPPRLDNPDLAEALRPLAHRLTPRAVSGYLAEFGQWLALLDTTVNRQLLVEQALIRWQSLKSG